MCAACYKAHKKSTEEPQPDKEHGRDISPEEHRATVNGLAAYIRARRDRGIPPEGTIWDPTIIHAALDLEAMAS